jgi:hypothetical protein
VGSQSHHHHHHRQLYPRSRTAWTPHPQPEYLPLDLALGLGPRGLDDMNQTRGERPRGCPGTKAD